MLIVGKTDIGPVVDPMLRRVDRRVSRRIVFAHLPDAYVGTRGIVGHRDVVVRGSATDRNDQRFDRERISEFFAAFVPFQTVHGMRVFRFAVGTTGRVYRVLDALGAPRPQVYGRFNSCRQIVARTPIQYFRH